MSSIKIILRTDKTRKNGEAPLYIRLIQDRKTRFKSLGIALAPKYWNEDKEVVRKSHRNSTRLNKMIADEKAKVQALALDVEEGKASVREQRMKQALEGRCTESVLDAADALLEQLRIAGKHGTVRTYGSAFGMLRKYLRDELDADDLTYADVTVEFLDGYVQYMKVERGNSVNTINGKIKPLRILMYEAERKQIIKIQHNPFHNFKTPTKKAHKVIPRQAEMQAIETVELPEGGNAWHVRNMYVFARYMAGLRYGDVVSLRWMNVDGDRLYWKTGKTDKQGTSYIPAEARAILDRYRRPDDAPGDFIFPFLRGYEDADSLTLYKRIGTENAKSNEQLRKVAERAGLGRHFSFHTSRHFFATDSIRNNVNPAVLQKLMTHSTLSQTMEYVEVVNDEADKAMQEMERRREELRRAAKRMKTDAA